MAAELNIWSHLEIDGHYSGGESISKKFTATTPVEVVKGSPVTGTTGTTLDLGDIAAGSGYFLYLEAITGNFYVKLGATTGDPVATDSHLYIKEGQGYPVPINPNSTAMSGIRFISDDASGQLLYMLVGG